MWRSDGQRGRNDLYANRPWAVRMAGPVFGLPGFSDGETDMNFPLEYPIFKFFYWLVDTPGVGSVLALLAGGGSILSYSLVLRWITRPDHDESEVYSYPTPALHDHDSETH
jgi:hypothetical protein